MSRYVRPHYLTEDADDFLIYINFWHSHEAEKENEGSPMAI